MSQTCPENTAARERRRSSVKLALFDLDYDPRLVSWTCGAKCGDFTNGSRTEGFFDICNRCKQVDAIKIVGPMHVSLWGRPHMRSQHDEQAAAREKRGTAHRRRTG